MDNLCLNKISTVVICPPGNAPYKGVRQVVHVMRYARGAVRRGGRVSSVAPMCYVQYSQNFILLAMYIEYKSHSG